MSIYDSLNDKQKEAVLQTEGPLLILAGAGSGKTRVITHRIAYLIEKGVRPYNILAITFTNKAAGEMRERVNSLVEYGAESIWISTFHSMCVRILRRFIDRLGYENNFTIYDTDDQKTVIKDICKRINIDTKYLKERAILAEISHAKNEMLQPEDYEKENNSDFAKKKIIMAYKEYQKQLKKNNALDFDDLLVKTVELFRTNPDVLENYQEKFKYIMVDEYQDTNTVQFMLVQLLGGKYKNVCVVGDDDQSIYGFRGANIANILDFEKTFKDTKVIKLEQNYRSTKNILNAANSVIAHNERRKEKSLWTDNDEGGRIFFRQLESDREEAEYIADQISELKRKNEFGLNDIPKRGIGATTVSKVDTFAQANEMSFYDALSNENAMAILGRSASKIKPFVYLIQRMRALTETDKISDIMEALLEETGYAEELKAEGTPEALSRVDNINEFFNKIVDYEESHEKATLSEFLEEISLVADIDNLEMDSDYVVLMTIHSAKGLEFPKVFLCGMEEGLFPGKAAIFADGTKEIEEERRLCYVAITRAKKSLTITSAKHRMTRGEVQFNAMSRFIKEIPRLIMDANVSAEKMSPKKSTFAPSANAHAASIMKTKSFEPKQFKVSKPATLEYQTGDMVKHIKFGVGKVMDIAEGGRDFEVTVDFEKAGTKKMFASFAKLKKI